MGVVGIRVIKIWDVGIRVTKIWDVGMRIQRNGCCGCENPEEFGLFSHMGIHDWTPWFLGPMYL